MTLLLAKAISAEQMLIASDRLILSGYDKFYVEKKWDKLGAWHVGGAGAAGCTQALVMGNDEPVPCTLDGFIRWMRRCLESHGCGPHKDDEGVSVYPGTFLIVRGSRIWKLSRDLCTIEIPFGLWGFCGNGQDIAAGAMAAMDKYMIDSDVSKARVALEITAKQNSGVEGVWIETIDVDTSNPLRTEHRPLEVPD